MFIVYLKYAITFIFLIYWIILVCEEVSLPTEVANGRDINFLCDLEMLHSLSWRLYTGYASTSTDISIKRNESAPLSLVDMSQDISKRPIQNYLKILKLTWVLFCWHILILYQKKYYQMFSKICEGHIKTPGAVLLASKVSVS